jgi:pyridoxamine 5'-phosphate oxidase family protein
VALLIDDLATVDPWSPRYLRVYGTAELIDRQTDSGVKPIMKITPHISWSLNLPGQPLGSSRSTFTPRRTVHHKESP